MKSVSTTWTASLTPRELADFFRETSEAIFSTGARRFLSAVPGRGTAGKMRFFTPQDDGSPFSQFDEATAFSVGVQGPQGGVINGAMLVTVHMYVFEDGPSRRVDFAAPYDRINSSKNRASEHVRRFGEALAVRDPQARERR